MNDVEWVSVAEFGTLAEAELAAGRLESDGIPCRIDQQGAVGIFGPGHAGTSVRGIRLEVPSSSLAEARKALDLHA